MKKRILAMALALALCLSGLPAAGAAQTPLSFPDVTSGHWAYDSIRWALENGVTNGCEDGNFQPETTVSNAQFCAFIIRRFFPGMDTGDGDPWWKPYVDACTGRRLLLGTSLAYGESEPEDPITRYDVAKVVAFVIKDKGIPTPEESELEAVGAAISDWAAVPQQYQRAVGTCYAMGLLNGLGDGSFGGDAYLDRAQTCAVLQRLDSTVEQYRQPAHIGQQVVIPAGGGYTAHVEPSTGVWTGWQGRDYGAVVDSREEALATNESVIEQYPKHVILFSKRDLGITTSDASKLFEPYVYKYGIGGCGRQGYIFMSYYPDSMSEYRTADGYYEYRITFCRGAAGTIRMYQAGLLDELPTVEDTYYDENEQLAADFQPLLDAVEEIKTTYGVDENSSEFDRAYACYRWITSHVSYDYESFNADNEETQEIFGRIPEPKTLNRALIDGKAMCGGFTMLYQTLCCIFHVNCVGLNGYKLNHSWNMVQIDGQWYMADPTWDAGENPALYQYFLVRTDSDARVDGTRLAEEQFSITGSTTDYPDTWRQSALEEFLRGQTA